MTLEDVVEIAKSGTTVVGIFLLYEIRDMKKLFISFVERLSRIEAKHGLPLPPPEKEG